MWPPPPLGWQFWTPVEDGDVGVNEPQWQFRPRPVDGHRYAVIALALAGLDLILLLGAAVWTVITSVVGHPLLGVAEFSIFFVPMFPVFGWAVWTLQALGERRATRRNRRPFPPAHEVIGSLTRRTWALIGLGFAAALTALFVSLATGTLAVPNGQPAYNRALHRYELNDHGSVTIISKVAYEQTSVAIEHLFMIVAALFLTLALPIHLGRWRRWRASTALQNEQSILDRS